MLAWPPIDPTSVGGLADTLIPAGWRYVNGNENYLSGDTLTIGTLNVTNLTIAP